MVTPVPCCGSFAPKHGTSIVCANCNRVRDPLVWAPEVFSLFEEAHRAILARGEIWQGEASMLRSAFRGPMWLRRVYQMLKDHRGGTAALEAVRRLAEAMGENVDLPYATAWPSHVGEVDESWIVDAARRA